ncbi:MAG: GNAT family N-acetyltransferase [Clostridia bacterium]|nr:GNAT family N-acetyltransferase [Clostridia bacterium]
MELLIRKAKSDDLEAFCRLLSAPETTRYLEGPFTKERTERFLSEAGLTDPPLIYAAEADGEFIGYVIYHGYDERSVEIGWVLLPEHRKKGYASKLTEMMIEKANSSGKEAVIECSPDNEASRRIARKFGFRYEGTSDGLDVFRLRPENKA